MRSSALGLLLVAACALLATHAYASDERISGRELLAQQAQFAAWQKEYGRLYSSEGEYSRRFANFQATLARNARLNREHGGSAVFGLTQFADLSEEEFAQQYLTYKPSPESLAAYQRGEAGLMASARKFRKLSVPDDVDWRKAGVVTPVMDQGQCGSCWAVSAVGQIESVYLQANPERMADAAAGQWGLSVQEMLDCNNYVFFGGCKGGWAALAYNFVQQRGIVNSTAYPYTAGRSGMTGMCLPLAEPETYVSNHTFATPPCFFNCEAQNMQHVLQTLADEGPLSVCLNAGGWSSYKGGIYNATKCSPDFMNMNHCVQLVGYHLNTTDASQSYWILKNSWGDKWGEKDAEGRGGYIHLQLDLNLNSCGMANQASSVIISDQPSPLPGADASKKMLSEQ